MHDKVSPYHSVILIHISRDLEIHLAMENRKGIKCWKRILGETMYGAFANFL